MQGIGVVVLDVHGSAYLLFGDFCRLRGWWFLVRLQANVWTTCGLEVAASVDVGVLPGGVIPLRIHSPLVMLFG